MSASRRESGAPDAAGFRPRAASSGPVTTAIFNCARHAAKEDKKEARRDDTQQPRPHPEQGTPNTPAPALIADLIAELPQHPRLPTLARVPRGLGRGYARVRIMVLEWMLDAADSGLSADICLAWSSLARLLPWLLLYDDRDPDTAHATRVDNGADTPAGARRRVVNRLYLAEQGQWHTFINEAIAAERQHSRRATKTATAGPALQASAMFARVVKHALAGSLKAAKRILLGADTLPPGPATTAAVLDLYKSTPQHHCDTFPPAPPPGPRKVSTKDVTQKLRALRTSAHPGPNQERNTHLQELLHCPRGASTLARWCDSWRTGSLPDVVRQQWLYSHVVALDKGEGKARPILLQEALLKLATGVVIQIHQRRIQHSVGDFQHGLGGAAGAPQVVWQVRAAMHHEPFATYVGIDCRNAFGMLSRQAVVAEADERVPQIATLLRSMWKGASPRMLIQQQDGSLADYPVVDGLAQGGCDSQPAFCLGIGRALRTFQQRCRAAGIRVRLWAYVDDVVLQVQAEHTVEAINILDKTLEEIGLERRPDKCRWYVPGATTTTHYPDHVGAPAQGGLPILGSVADGAFRAIVMPPDATTTATATATQPALDRLDHARALAKRIGDLMQADCDVPVLHAAYKLTVGVLNQALSYDICVLPLAYLGPVADQLDNLVVDIVRRIVGDEWHAHTQALLRLPRSHGGCGILATSDRAHTAFLSTVLRCPPAVTADPTAWTAGGILHACQSSIAWLQAQGVWLDGWAMPRKEAPHHLDTLTAAMLPAIPLPRRQPVWREALAAIRAAALADVVPFLDSRAGMEGGAVLTANGSEMQVDLTDAEFRTYIRMRMGLSVCKHQRCQHRSASGADRMCQYTSDVMGHHALLCKLGGGLTSVHNAICSILLQAMRAAGYSALKEQVIAELATSTRREPRVDVDAWGLVAEPRVLLDVTVTCPFAQRYEDKSAAACGEHRKDREYPRRAGLAVTGVAVDVFGRHGPALQELLLRLADLARQHDVDCGNQPRRWLHKWRVRIATEVARGCARLIHTANSSSAPVRHAAPAMCIASQPTTTCAPPVCAAAAATTTSTTTCEPASRTD